MTEVDYIDALEAQAGTAGRHSLEYRANSIKRLRVSGFLDRPPLADPPCSGEWRSSPHGFAVLI
ncbi:hypothetical protein ACNJ7E_31045 [Rhodococcus sp. NM-2]|jgi:hypothetical protein|uniref:hypothetical protein n=1 Tax=Rhodococcus sp. NM-2 TaxID=3401174 RepID=UPI003AAE7F49